MKFYYPSNMEAPPLLGLWALKDLAVIALTGVITLFIAVWVHLLLPLLGVLVYAFFTITFDDISIYRYVTKLCRYFMTQQLIYRWEEPA